MSDRMNLAEALAFVAAMSPAEKAAWDQANGFTTDAMRDYRASQAVFGMADAIAPRPPVADDLDALITARNNAHNLTLATDAAYGLLRIWPDDFPDVNWQKEWLDPA